MSNSRGETVINAETNDKTCSLNRQGKADVNLGGMNQCYPLTSEEVEWQIEWVTDILSKELQRL